VTQGAAYRKPLNIPAEEFKPLTIGAAYAREFICRTPAAWGEMITYTKMFKLLPLHNAGWADATLTSLGVRGWLALLASDARCVTSSPNKPSAMP
jgi:hypothetical protein